MEHKPTTEDFLRKLLHDEADAESVGRLAEAAENDAAVARRVGEELEFSELIRQALRGDEFSPKKFDGALESTALEPEEWIARVREGSATPFECDQAAKHLWDRPEAAAELRRRLAEDEWLFEAVSPSKGAEAFVEALETRMWAETKQDHFVQDLTARLEREVLSDEEVPDNVVAFPGRWAAPVLRVGAVAAAVAVGAFFGARQWAGDLDTGPIVALVAKASFDASWSRDSGPAGGGSLKSGRYQLDSGVVSLKFPSGREMTVEGPAVFDVNDDASTFVHHGLALTRMSGPDTGISLRSRGLTVSDTAQLVGIDARSENSTDAIVFGGDGGVCLTERGICRELYQLEAVKADHTRDKLVDIPYNPHAFTRAWELLSGVEKNTGSVRIELPGSEIGPSRDAESEVQVYVENESFRPEQDLEVDRIQVGEFARAETNPGQSLQSVGDLRSYLLQLWPAAGNGDSGEVEASLTFDHPVVGVIFTSDRLAGSDGAVGSAISHVGENFNEVRGLDSGNDLILLSEDRKTLNLRFRGGVSQVDQVRVLVALN
ncbi:MAG: hypothetical protein WD342_12725 [Verrucomicrobiales bacterium]